MGMTRFSRSRSDAGALDQHSYLRSPVGGEAEIGLFVSGGILLGLELDFSFQPLLALVELEHAGQGAVGGVVVDVRAGLSDAHGGGTRPRSFRGRR